ncbi:hypothetical protein BDBG_17730 [Blastomyces gilchristii SLH14081]|uniref:PhoD-like phosphatase metallophosphatase domain-containing protein n=1 Tax=Blastomyces gilchristii (strain SLH14081) TaxID=559298 RepID=A0A179UXX6_BLAGS|nr:uncharacterized protein BDBG_17730 [Blastomyces gilchristii SLH14081]OAT12934.1 hypothetical protein BDBG_17730 [Blastomyces gilchristii SLH14081]
MAFLELAMAGLSLSPITSASFSYNLNYRSHSHNHPDMGIAINKVHKRNVPSSPFNPEDLYFTHSVASGDPYSNSVIQWTCVSPMNKSSDSNVAVSGTAPLYDHGNDRYVSVSTAPVCVEHKVARDGMMRKVVTGREVWTSSDVDYTVKPRDFSMPTVMLPVKTMPITLSILVTISTSTKRASTMLFNGGYGWGWFMDRIPQPADHNTKLDSRMRYSSYRTDADILYSHQNFPGSPFGMTMAKNNIWKAGSSKMNNTEESFIKAGGISINQVKANAVRAHFEWMPIRQVDMDETLRIWRNFEIGDLFSHIMLDTRVYDGSLRESAKRKAKWRIVGQQVLISNITYTDGREETPYNADAWDGYRARKNRILSTILDNEINNTIFLAGDTHASNVSDLVYTGHGEYDPKSGSGAIGVEFGGSGVTSPEPVGQNGTFAKGAEK